MKLWTKISVSKSLANALMAVGILSALSGCGNKDSFVPSKTSESFVQDYNPHYVEVMWAIDDRSPMRNYHDELVGEAQNFFTRLDASLGVSGNYKMGITSMDGHYHEGALKPIGSPLLLRRGDGSLAERVSFFGNILFPLLNLATDAFNKGIEASVKALTDAPFTTDSRLPLVLVYLSYSDDQSTTPDNSEPVEYYAQKLLALKNGNPDLLRVYAANYMPIGAGVAPTAATRCALANGNQIDVDSANYQDRYFRLAHRLNGSTADLCHSGFSDSFDLSGLQLKVLPNVFSLIGYPDVTTLSVTLLDGSGAVIPGYPYTYDAAARQIVFTTTPPEGSTISVTYLPSGK
jgi:hypothetical protein